MPIRAVGVGTAALDLTTSGPNFKGDQHFALGVETGTPNVYQRKVETLAAGATLDISDKLVADFIPGTGSIAIAASPFGALDAPALLAALERYPYGCSEQTVSRAMPLIYANKLASIEHLAIDPDLDKRVAKAIETEMSRESSSGAFGLWAIDNDSDDLWLDAFVSDFLTRAKERGFDAPEPGFSLALDHLRNTAINSTDPDKDSATPIAYALYVLARNGRPIIGDLRYLADAKLRLVRRADGQGRYRRRACVPPARSVPRDARRPRARSASVWRRARCARQGKGRRLFAPRLRVNDCATAPRCWRCSPRPTSTTASSAAILSHASEPSWMRRGI